MKIVHLSTYDSGGAGIAALRLHRALLKAGADSCFIVPTKRSSVEGVSRLETSRIGLAAAAVRRLRVRGIRIEASKYEASKPGGVEIFSDDRSSFDWRSDARISGADIVNLHWVAGFMDHRHFFREAVRRGQAVVWTLHDMNPFTGGCHYTGDCTKYKAGCGACFQLGSRDPDDLSSRIWKRKNYAYARARIKAVGSSRWIADRARESSLMGKMPVTDISSSVPDEFFAGYKKEECRQTLNLPQDKTILLFGAERISNERKGIRYFSEALRIISSKMDVSGIEIAVFGKEDKRSEVCGKIPVHYLGSIQDEKLLAACYSAADIFVLPSLEDNQPNTALESLACGTMVVAFAAGGVPEMVEHGKTGLLSRLKDTEDLASNLREAVENRSLREAMSRNAAAVARQRYRMEIQAASYLDLYRGILGGRT